jgi:predicted amidophosphoribosyltransferase
MPLGRDLLDAVLPTDCVACGGLAGDGRFVRLCSRCAAELPGSAWPLASPIPGLRSGWYLLPYDGLGGHLVRAGKYGGRERFLEELAGWAAEVAAPCLPATDVLVAVPSPAGRVVRRGFSFPEMLAEALSRASGVPRIRPLRRTRVSKQAALGRAARQAHVRGTVRVHGALDGDPVVLLVDDVVTSGATAAACAEALLLGGARGVHLFALASALR